MTASEQVPPGFRRRVLRNTLFGAGGRLLGLAVSLVLTPYVVHRLGGERYALYALASILSGYLSLLDLGMGTGYVKYVAEAAAADDSDAVNEVLASGFYAYLGFGLSLVVLWWLGHDVALRLLGIDATLGGDALKLFTVAVIILSLSGSAAAFRAVLYGLQRIDVATRVGVALIVPRVILVVTALERGFGVVGLVLCDLVLFLFGTALMAIAARTLFPALSLRPGRARGACLRRLLRYGVKLQVSRVSEMVNFHLDKLLLARFVGLSSVTDYELGAKLLATTRSFPLLLLSALVPAVSELDARGARHRIEQIAQRVRRLLLLVATFAFALLAVEAPLVVELWLGPGHAASALAVRVLALGYLLNAVSGAFTSVTQGIARNDYQMRIALLSLGLNVGLSLALVVRLGYPGVLLGTTASLALTYVYAELSFRRLTREVLGVAGPVAARVFAAPAVAAALGACLSLGLHHVLGAARGPVAQLGQLVLGTATFAFGYLAALVLSGALTVADLALARESATALLGRGGAHDASRQT